MSNELIQNVDGKFYMKSKVIMFPTHADSTIVKDLNTLHFRYSTEVYQHEDYQPQHLYFLSDDAPKPRDFYAIADVSGNYSIYQCTRVEGDRVFYGNFNEEVLGHASTTSDFIDKCKKIIATTDEELRIESTVRESDELSMHYGKILSILGKPSDEFVKKYCELDGKIDEVLVELENKCTTHKMYGNQEKCLNPCPDWCINVKTEPDNTKRN